MATVAPAGAQYRVYSTGERFDSADRIRSFYEEVLGALPDMRIDVVNMCADVDRRQVFAQYVLRATHRGRLWGLAPTRRQLRYEGAILYEFDVGGRLTREETYFDRIEALVSVGALRDPASPLGAFLLLFPQSPLLFLRSLWETLRRRRRRSASGSTPT
jgi:predicted ester cyclase